MPITKTRYPFSERMIEGAPADMGVYALWRGEELIYLGRALGGSTTIQSRLREHMKGAVCTCSRQATHYSWEIVLQPVARELELLHKYRSEAGRMPSCNAHCG